MLSIEEARRELYDHLVEHIRAKTHPQAQCCMKRADTYVLATLNKALTTWRRDPDEYIQQQNALRDRIKELGKEGE